MGQQMCEILPSLKFMLIFCVILLQRTFLSQICLLKWYEIERIKSSWQLSIDTKIIQIIGFVVLYSQPFLIYVNKKANTCHNKNDIILDLPYYIWLIIHQMRLLYVITLVRISCNILWCRSLSQCIRNASQCNAKCCMSCCCRTFRYPVS